MAECDEIMELIKAPLIDRYNLFNGKAALTTYVQRFRESFDLGKELQDL